MLVAVILIQYSSIYQWMFVSTDGLPNYSLDLFICQMCVRLTCQNCLHVGSQALTHLEKAKRLSFLSVFQLAIGEKQT